MLDRSTFASKEEPERALLAATLALLKIVLTPEIALLAATVLTPEIALLP